MRKACRLKKPTQTSNARRHANIPAIAFHRITRVTARAAAGCIDLDNIKSSSHTL
jgi:hypothetical protein